MCCAMMRFKSSDKNLLLNVRSTHILVSPITKNEIPSYLFIHLLFYIVYCDFLVYSSGWPLTCGPFELASQLVVLQVCKTPSKFLFYFFKTLPNSQVSILVYIRVKSWRIVKVRWLL